MITIIKLLIIKDNKTYDVTEITQGFTHSGRKGSAGRSFSADLLHSTNFDHIDIDVREGCQCIAYDNDEEVFRGRIITQEYGKDKILKITARDNLIYFANNDDTFNYTDKKASDIFVDLCNRFQIEYEDVADTIYVIPKISIENGKLWDCLLEALEATYKAIGIRYYLTSIKGKANLLKRKESVQKWVVADSSNLVDYTYSKSIDGIVTRVKLTSEKGTTTAFAKDAQLEKNIGIFQKVLQKNDDLNSGQLSNEVETTLKIESAGQKQLTVTAIGINHIIAGCAIYVIIPELNINNSYYVDDDTHTYKGNYHEMRLVLNKTLEF